MKNRIDYFMKITLGSSTKNIVINFKDSVKAEKVIKAFNDCPNHRNIIILDFGYSSHNVSQMDRNTIGIIKDHNSKDILQSAYKRLV